MRPTINGINLTLTITRLTTGAKTYRYVVEADGKIIADLKSSYLYYAFPVFERFYPKPSVSGIGRYYTKWSNLRSAEAIDKYVGPAPTLSYRFIGLAEATVENLASVQIDETPPRKRASRIKPEVRIRYQVRRRSDNLLYAGLQHDLTDLFIAEGLLFTRDIDAAWLIVYKGYNPAEYAIDTVFLKLVKTTTEEETLRLISKYQKLG